MKRIAKLILIVFLFIMMISIQSNEINAENSKARIILNGEEANIFLDVDPIVKNNCVFVPLDFIEKALNCSINYSASSKTINIKKEDINMVFTIDSDTANKNKEKIKLNTPPFIEKERIFLPLRVIVEGIGQEIQWDEKKEIVLVGKYSGKIYTKDTFVYTNKEYGYTINLPNSWKEEALIETKDGILSVYDKKTLERFKEDGYMGCGPVFSIAAHDYCITVQGIGADYVLDFEDGKYIEASFDTDFQYYQETRESYLKIYKEAEKALGSFKKIDLDIIIQSPMTLSNNSLQPINGEDQYLRFKMVRGRYYEDWNLGAYMGTLWEGYYIIELSDEAGNIINKTDLSEIYKEPLIFDSSFNIEFDDYNNDGEKDFTIGQYASSNGNTYKLFTLRKNGKVEELPIKGYSSLFISNSKGKYSTKLKKLDNGEFEIEYYNNLKGKSFKDIFKWNGKEFIKM